MCMFFPIHFVPFAPQLTGSEERMQLGQWRRSGSCLVRHVCFRRVRTGTVPVGGGGEIDFVARRGGTSSLRRLPPPSPFFGRPRFFVGIVREDVTLTGESIGKASLSHSHHCRQTGPALAVHGWSKRWAMSNAKLGEWDWGSLEWTTDSKITLANS